MPARCRSRRAICSAGGTADCARVIHRPRTWDRSKCFPQCGQNGSFRPQAVQELFHGQQLFRRAAKRVHRPELTSCGDACGRGFPAGAATPEQTGGRRQVHVRCSRVDYLDNRANRAAGAMLSPSCGTSFILEDGDCSDIRRQAAIPPPP